MTIALSRKDAEDALAIRVVTTAPLVPAGQAKELEHIVDGFATPRLAHIALGLPPRGWGRDGVWIYYKIKAPNNVELARGEWQALIAAGLLRDIARERRWARVRGYSFTLVSADGTEEPEETSILGTAFSGKVLQASEGELRSLLESAAKKAGVDLVNMRFARPFATRHWRSRSKRTILGRFCAAGLKGSVDLSDRSLMLRVARARREPFSWFRTNRGRGSPLPATRSVLPAGLDSSIPLFVKRARHARRSAVQIA